MSGYGGPDDEAQRASIRVEEQIELARSLLPKGNGTNVCIGCGERIPELRKKALPGVVRCVDCQGDVDHNKPTFKEPWAT